MTECVGHPLEWAIFKTSEESDKLTKELYAIADLAEDEELPYEYAAERGVSEKFWLKWDCASESAYVVRQAFNHFDEGETVVQVFRPTDPGWRIVWTCLNCGVEQVSCWYGADTPGADAGNLTHYPVCWTYDGDTWYSFNLEYR